MISDEDEDGELLLNDDEMEDSCFECGCRERYYDPAHWESCCKGCGLVGTFENDTEVPDLYVKPKTYFKHNYFSGSILPDAMTNGFRISRVEMGSMERLYKECVNKFYRTQPIHKRKYFLSSKFVLMKICDKLGKDVRPYIKLPKKETLSKLEKDWEIINPF